MALNKKVCLLGAFGVGKTSLVARYVRGIYSEKYQTTIGVKIDKKEIRVGTQDLTLVVWDIAGEDEFHTVRESYLRGSAGLLFVVDGTRRDTLNVAQTLDERARAQLGDVPSLWLLNKRDLDDQWELTPEDLASIPRAVETSSKSGNGVDDAFADLAGKVLA